jgi:hypothetical protein
MHSLFAMSFSLTPGFSPVRDGRGCQSRFNGFVRLLEAAEAAETVRPSSVTGLKPGANDKNHFNRF